MRPADGFDDTVIFVLGSFIMECVIKQRASGFAREAVDQRYDDNKTGVQENSGDGDEYGHCVRKEKLLY